MKDAAAHAAQRERLPAGIPYIVSNEFAERFCYYGINAILSVYMVQFLHFGEAQATAWQSLFKSGVYLCPLLGAILSDVLWGKFRTIIVFSIAYSIGCTVLALSTGQTGLALGLVLIAFGTGGIKPCVSTNVGDQFTSKNQHLIERAFSWFYLSVNAGAIGSILFCPWLLDNAGPRWAFGIPAAAMAVATLLFWSGRRRFAVVPPAGKQWLADVFSADGARLVGRLGLIYLFLAVFFSLLEQASGVTWTLQAQSDLVDKTLGFGITLLPAQIFFFNPLFILLLVPLLSYGVYPRIGRLVTVTPLRKIGVGFFVAAISFALIAKVESRIQNGIVTSVWWQILAYAILTLGEVLISVTALEYSYKQAPLRIKSFVMALYLLSFSAGNLLTAAVAIGIEKPIHGVDVIAGEQTTLVLPSGLDFVPGQKIDFGRDTGMTVHLAAGGERPLEGTFLVGERHDGRTPLLDVISRRPVATDGHFNSVAAVSTYRLVGPQFFMFFFYLTIGTGVIWVFVSRALKEKSHLRPSSDAASGLSSR